MRELSENILDIAQNSVVANSKNISIEIEQSVQKDILSFCITDDGKGMSEDFLANVLDPFTTSRTTRKVGMGLPLLKSLTEMSNGSFEIFSKLGEGTRVKAVFQLSNIDRLPLGNIVDTFMVLLGNDTPIDYKFTVKTDDSEYIFDTKEVKEILGDVKICEAEVLQVLKNELNENIGGMNL